MTTQPGRDILQIRICHYTLLLPSAKSFRLEKNKVGFLARDSTLFFYSLKVSADGNKMKWKYCLNDDLQVLFIKRLRFGQSDFFCVTSLEHLLSGLAVLAHYEYSVCRS